jgi:methanogenic corrinoid protein MtbC1
MTTKAEILAKLSEAVLKFEEDDTRDAATEALENHMDASEAILNGQTKKQGIVRVQGYYKKFYFKYRMRCAAQRAG